MVRKRKTLPSTGVRTPVGQHVCTRTYAYAYASACTQTYLVAHIRLYGEFCKRLKVSIARTFAALLRLLANVCQWTTNAVFLWPVHERVIICRNIHTQQTVTVHSCQKNAGVVDSFAWLLAHLLPPLSLYWPAVDSFCM